jgi:lipopolysaccharide export system protein LptA
LINSGFKYKTVCLFFLIFNILLAQQEDENAAVQSSGKDSIQISADTVTKERLEDVVNSSADEIRNTISKKFSYLINNAKVTYQDMEMNADYIVIDWNTSDIYARGKTDSLGRIVGTTTFTQAGKKYEYREARFNMKTKQGLTYNVRTEESEGVIVAEVAKKMNDDEYYMRRGIYTTDEYFKAKKDSIPDYYLSADKMKLIKSKTLVTGPIEMYIEQIPTPFMLPFAILPATSKRSAGLLIGTFGERQSKGFYLDRWGVYIPIGEYADYEFRTGAYTKGSWMLDNNLRYTKRYRYSGNLSFRFDKNINSTKGLPDYSESSNYSITWSHSQSDKANPNLTFSASVNYMSSNYYANSVNPINLVNSNVVSNQTNSSVSVVKRFNTTPLTVSANVSANQSIQLGTVTMVLPQLAVNMPQFYPFAPKSGTKKGLLQNLSMDYRMDLRNNLTTTTDDMFTQRMFDNAKNGIQQTTQLSTGGTILNYFQFTLGGNYKEIWATKTQQTISYWKNSGAMGDSLKIETFDKNGFASYRTFNLSAGLSTTLYGQLNFNKEGLIRAIRHVVTPSISFGYTPDFSDPSWGYYSTYLGVDGKPVKYSYFKDNIFGAPPSGLSNSIGISIANNLEMKVRDQSDKKKGERKIKIFDYLNIGTSYNMAADSLRWSPISVNGATSLWNSKLKVNYSMTMNPYKAVYNIPKGGYSPTWHYVDEFGNFAPTNYSIGLTFGLDPTMFGEKTDYGKKYKKQGTIRYEKYYFDDDNYAHFDLPWRINTSLNYNYSKAINGTLNKTIMTSLSGSVSPSPYWNINFTTNYDLMAKEFTYTTIGLSRDLRSFTINFNWNPMGYYKSWDFFIGIKANILRDAVKYQDRSFRNYGSSF